MSLIVSRIVQMRMCFVELWTIVRLVVRGSLVFVGGFVDPGGTTLNSLKTIVLSHYYRARCKNKRTAYNVRLTTAVDGTDIKFRQSA